MSSWRTSNQAVRSAAAYISFAHLTTQPLALEKWGLGPANLHPLNPSLIFTRISGYGQTGPWSSRPGYASVCEAESGFRYINGFPDPETGALSGPPVRPNMSLGDSVAGLHAAFGTLLALLSRERGKAGKVVDVSIVERSVEFLAPCMQDDTDVPCSMVNLMEGMIPEYDRKGIVFTFSLATYTQRLTWNPQTDPRRIWILPNRNRPHQRLPLQTRPRLPHPPILHRHRRQLRLHLQPYDARPRSLRPRRSRIRTEPRPSGTERRNRESDHGVDDAEDCGGGGGGAEECKCTCWTSV